MAAAALVPFITLDSKEPIAILNRDMHLIVEELVDQILTPLHHSIVPQVVANINRFTAKTKILTYERLTLK
jgi:hypothetical protein